MDEFDNNQEDFNTEGDSENAHWWNVLRSFLFYSNFSFQEVDIKEQRIRNLPAILQEKLSEKTKKKFQLVREGMQLNQEFFDDVVHFHSQFLTPPQFALQGLEGNTPFPSVSVGPEIPYTSQHRNLAVLHSCFREWSEGGEIERRDCFFKMISLLSKFVPITTSAELPPKVLVPGCGLGRLPLEVASRGYICEGNEFSA